MKLNHKYVASIIFIVLAMIAFSCKDKSDREEIVELVKIVEDSQPRAQEIMDRFSSLQNQSGPGNPSEFAKNLAQLVVDIDELMAPVRRLDPESEEAGKLKEEYIVMWGHLQDAMRMILEVMATGDPRLVATLQERVLAKDAEFQMATRKFESDFVTITKRHNIEIKAPSLSGANTGQAPPGEPRPMVPPTQR